MNLFRWLVRRPVWPELIPFSVERNNWEYHPCGWHNSQFFWVTPGLCNLSLTVCWCKCVLLGWKLERFGAIKVSCWTICLNDTFTRFFVPPNLVNNIEVFSLHQSKFPQFLRRPLHSVLVSRPLPFWSHSILARNPKQIAQSERL